MAKMEQGILSDIKGSIGKVIGSSHLGTRYIRSKPKQYNDAKTSEQLGQRNNFIACTKLAKSLKSTIIDPIWKLQADPLSGYNLFIKKNIAAFSNHGKTIDYAKLLLSVGKLTPPENLKIIVSEQYKNLFSISWENNLSYNPDNPNDKLVMIIIDIDNPMVFNNLNYSREAGNAFFLMPQVASQIIHGYLFFQNISNNHYSVSTYAQFNL